MSNAVPSRLKSLLESLEEFPHDFVIKFIGRNTERFRASVLRFEKDYPTLRTQNRRESTGSGHVAHTYLYLAKSADEIIEILDRVAKIEDVHMVL